ncbi:MAG: PD-(D/E)XK nuclease family protein [Oscillospiraceae bacterium]|nr:PD-(D/E)XK nuclease family protein [Oscillospiraceae bacterium]
MSVEIFYGDAGTGKTAAMLERIKETAERGEQCILFVPEQFSFDTERAVYFGVGAKNSRFVKVTGFSKLSREILTFYKKARPCADDAVKLITMWKTVEDIRRDFLSFNKEKNSAQLCRLMLKTVAAFRNGGISPEQLRKTLAEQSGMEEELADKAEDFLRIYEEYDRTLTLDLDDKLDDVSRAAELAEQHGYFKDKHLFFDNFDSFSAAQKRLLAAALPQCESGVFCFTADSPHSRKRQFICVSKTVREVGEIAPAELREFRRQHRAAKRDESSVEIYAAKTTYDEAELIAAKIHHLVREQGLRYRDFLVLTADAEYEQILASQLEKSEIPVFCDFPHPMTDKPVVGFVLQLLRCLDFDTEEILRLAESGFKRIQEGERARLLLHSEAYSLRQAATAYEIAPEDWQRDWSSDPRRELRELEELRKGIAEPLIKLRTSLEQAKNGAEMSEIFMTYLLEEEDIQATFKARAKAGAGGETDYLETDPESAEEYSRIWDALSEAFSSMAYCLENVKPDAEQYRYLLEEILTGISLANPPAVLDSVTVGDIERTRKAAPKIVIIAGVNEGHIPRKSSLQSAFTYFERESLTDCGLPLYDTNLNRWSKEHYFTYRAMSLYEKRLILTYCSQSTAGAELAPSEVLEQFRLPHQNVEELPDEFFLNTVGDVRRALAECWGDNEKQELAEGLTKLLGDERYCGGLQNSLLLMKGQRKMRLSEDTAIKLLGSAEYSPTRLESAFGCPFNYFCKYGLKLFEPQDADPAAAVNIGNAVHYIMRLALEESGNIAGKSDEELYGLAEKTVKRAAEEAAEKDPTFPPRTMAIYQGLINRVHALLKQTRLDIENSGFVPSEFEKRVDFVIEDDSLPEHKTVRIVGVADRIDRLEADGNTYIMIYDYKTGKKGFSAEGVESGSDLQMLLYLFAECEKDLPAGVSYVRASKQTPLRAENTEETSPAAQAKSWYSEHSLSGAVFDSPQVVSAFERIEAALCEETDYKPRNGHNRLLKLSAAKFGEFRSFVEKQVILPKIRSLLEGGIEAVPLENGSKLPCAYCQFWACCGNRNGKHGSAVCTGSKVEEYETKKEA